MQIKFEADVLMSPNCSLDTIAKSKSVPHIVAKGTDMTAYGYTLIGSAKVTVDLHSNDSIVQRQIEALNKQLQSERAESQRRQNAILDKISKLQALEFTPA